MEQIEPIDIYSIVSAFYYDITGNRKIGLFLVIYKEELDSRDFNNRNVVGFKLTSHDAYANAYRIPLSRKDCPYLFKDSFLYTNKPTVLMASQCRFVGKLSPALSEEVFKHLEVFHDEVNAQCFKELLGKFKKESV